MTKALGNIKPELVLKIVVVGAGSDCPALRLLARRYGSPPSYVLETAQILL